MFTCYLLTSSLDHAITGVEWLLNGSTLANLTKVRTTFSSIGNGQGFIDVPLVYNNTTIQCVATIDPPQSREDSSSPVATLLVQGKNKIAA